MEADVDNSPARVSCISCFSVQLIHDKIESLDLKQVHAKIKQMDSHSTLGHGIVVQVRWASLRVINFFVFFIFIF